MHLIGYLARREFSCPTKQSFRDLQIFCIRAYLRIIDTGSDQHKFPILSFFSKHFCGTEQSFDIFCFFIEAGNMQKCLNA